MRIGIDIDEVLVPLLASILAAYNRRHGTSYRAEEFWTYRLEEVMGRGIDELIAEVREFYRSEAMRALLPFPEAVAGVNALLAAGHELVAVTSRHSEARALTPPWLERHFPGAFSDILFSGGHAWHGEMKATLCREHAIPVLVDDDWHNAEECAAEGVTLLLLDRPWNREAAGRFIRVRDWDGILREIGELEKGK